MKLPNFLVIGAAKSGTTSLYEYLRQHPEVFLPDLKEPRFFAFEGEDIEDSDPVNRRTVTNLADYASLFEGAEGYGAIGEVSPAYLPCAEAPERIHRHLGEVKLVALLREPVERAYSHFLFAVQKGFEPEGVTFEEAIREPTVRVGNRVRRRPYVSTGFYARHLERYYARFPADAIRVYLFEDLTDDPLAFARDVFEFLEVDRTFEPVGTTTRHAKSGIPRSRALHGALRGSKPLRAVARAMVPTAIRSRLRTKIVNLNLQKPPMPNGERAHLRRLYRDDIERLEDLLERDLSTWRPETRVEDSSDESESPGRP